MTKKYEQKKGLEHVRFIQDIVQQMLYSNYIVDYSIEDCIREALDLHKRKLSENEKSYKKDKT